METWSIFFFLVGFAKKTRRIMRGNNGDRYRHTTVVCRSRCVIVI